MAGHQLHCIKKITRLSKWLQKLFWCNELRTSTVPYSTTYKKTINTRTQTFNGPLSRTTRVSRYQKGKTNLDFTEETVSGSSISWAICKSAPCSTDNHASTPPLSFFTGRMPFLPPNQQRQSTEGEWPTMSKRWRKSYTSTSDKKLTCYIYESYNSSLTLIWSSVAQ